MPQIICKNLTIGYDGRAIAENINFSVSAGDYLCVVGGNGSGKSTLIKTLLGLAAPISGEFIMGGGLNEIGYLPQQTQVQRDFPASVWEIILSGCQARCGIRPFYSRQEKALAYANMERMRITELKNKCYYELSGGQQQRVLLARALCAARSALLLDEPVLGLDPKVTKDLYALIDSLNKNDGMTIIMISHDIAAAAEYASHILHIGDSIFFGAKDEYLKSGHFAQFKECGGNDI